MYTAHKIESPTWVRGVPEDLTNIFSYAVFFAILAVKSLQKIKHRA